MKTVSVYLAGQVKGLEDSGAAWRKQMSSVLKLAAENKGVGIEIVNPLDYFSYEIKKNRSNKQVKEYYLSRLKKCDVVLVNCNGTAVSIGTAQEIQFAVDHGIPVIGFGTDNTYPWITEVDCQVCFGSWLEAADYVTEYYF